MAGVYPARGTTDRDQRARVVLVATCWPVAAPGWPCRRGRNDQAGEDALPGAQSHAEQHGLLGSAVVPNQKEPRVSSDPAQGARKVFLVCSLFLLPVVVLAVVLALLNHPIGAGIVWVLFAILTVALAVIRSRIFRKARAAEPRRNR
jgi:hypothetical protein